MAKPTDPKVPREKEPPPPERDDKLPHDLPMFPEDAPLDGNGEPVVRP